MSGSSSSPFEKSSAIHPNAKETIRHTYSDVLASLNEKIFTRFRGLLGKAPVVFVNEQIPAEVLDWYKIYVFGQAKEKVQPLTSKLTLESAKESPIKPPIKSPVKSPVKPTIEPPIKPSIVPVIEPAINTIINPINPDEREDTPNIADDESIVMDFEVAKEALYDSANYETSQSVSILSKDSSEQAINNEKVTGEDKIVETINQKDGDKSEKPTESTKLNCSNEPEKTKEEGNNRMDFEVTPPVEESTKPESSRSLVNQPAKESFKPKVETNLQLSEESSNESINNLEDNDEINTEIMQNLLSTVLSTIKEDSKPMEIEDESKQLTDDSSLLESNQSMSAQSCGEDQGQSSKLEIITQSSIQLSEESSDGSISMDEEDDQKDDNESNDKIQNIKNNSNVLAAIEDENNVLDFEDN